MCLTVDIETEARRVLFNGSRGVNPRLGAMFNIDFFTQLARDRVQSKSKVKLYQIPGYGFPGLHAECFQTARMAEAFLECGVNATVVYPRSSRIIPWRDVCATYGVHRSLKRKVLPGFYLTSSRWRSVSNPLLRISLALFAIKSGGNSIFLGRHVQLEPLGTLIRLRMRNLLRARIVVELHEPHHYVPDLDQHIDGYVVISKGLESFLLNAGVDARRIVLAPNAVDLPSYEQAHHRKRSALRRQLRLSEERSIICYTGQLGPGRNVETLIQAMQYLEENVDLLLVGGRNSDDVHRLEEFVASNRLSQRVKLLGQQPTQAVIDFQVASDVLVIPYNSHLAHARWCSPLKLWEYLASSNPIVAFPIPALREVLRDDEVVWAKEETAVALAAAIREALTRKPRAFDEIRARIGDWTWVDRAQRMLGFIDASPRRVASPAKQTD